MNYYLMQGPGLPIGIFHHAIVEIGNEKVMLIGGRKRLDISAQTYIYNKTDNDWLFGPLMIQAREDHAAGILTDEATMEKFVLVTGGMDSYSKELKSTEILRQDMWSSGNNLFSMRLSLAELSYSNW